MPKLRLGRITVGASVALIAGSLGACAAGGDAGRADRRVVERPVVAQSAAAAHPAGPDGDMAFFDDLETRAVVSRDDVLRGLFAAVEGDGGEGGQARADAARNRGWSSWRTTDETSFAATIGEIGVIVARAAGRDATTDRDGVAELARRRLVERSTDPRMGVTGPQLLSVLHDLATEVVVEPAPEPPTVVRTPGDEVAAAPRPGELPPTAAAAPSSPPPPAVAADTQEETLDEFVPAPTEAAGPARGAARADLPPSPVPAEAPADDSDTGRPAARPEPLPERFEPRHVPLAEPPPELPAPARIRWVLGTPVRRGS